MQTRKVTLQIANEDRPLDINVPVDISLESISRNGIEAPLNGGRRFIPGSQILGIIEPKNEATKLTQ